MQNSIHQHTNRIIRYFLQDETSAFLVRQAIEKPTLENRQRVEKRFQTFYNEIQLISYLSGLIHYQAIAYDRRLRAYQYRCPRSLDAPLGEEGDGTLLDIMTATEEELTDFDTFTSLEEISESKELYYALRLLTEHERKIIEWAYLYCLSDTDIARQLYVSQQTVSRTRSKALAKLRMSVKEEQQPCQSPAIM
ncbi:sigma-70 family RNA polymerase sigma factor [Aneurinibacillus sp. REN35]|uniref:sigma-70 family RNA polymerase sigma factor n=1 Tax=Aneurinibacillus sp. REN35 TaxID=3237286 RepID=UPI003526E9B3